MAAARRRPPSGWRPCGHAWPSCRPGIATVSATLRPTWSSVTVAAASRWSRARPAARGPGAPAPRHPRASANVTASGATGTIGPSPAPWGPRRRRRLHQARAPMAWILLTCPGEETFPMRPTFDEMQATSTTVREHYRGYDRWLSQQPRDVMRSRREEAEMIFRRVGITFAVYGAKDEDGSGTERLIPFDLIPRVIPAHEWAEMEKGLVQRVNALNRFIHDVYHGQEIIRAGI